MTKISHLELINFIKDPLSKTGVKIIFFLLIFIMVVMAILWGKLPPYLPLFYSKPWGKEQLAPKIWFFYLPFTCLLIISVNLILACWFLKKEHLLTKILLWTSVILVLLIFITIAKILFIVL